MKSCVTLQNMIFEVVYITRISVLCFLLNLGCTLILNGIALAGFEIKPLKLFVFQNAI